MRIEIKIASRCWGVLALAGIWCLSVRPAVADDAAELRSATDQYMACGRDYVKAQKVPTVQAAETACSKHLDEYGFAMRTFALNAQKAQGKPLETAKSFAEKKETWAKKEALGAFAKTVKDAIDAKH